MPVKCVLTVTSRVPNADKQQSILLLCHVNGLWTPHLPCYRVVHMSSHLGSSCLVRLRKLLWSHQAQVEENGLTYGLRLSLNLFTNPWSFIVSFLSCVADAIWWNGVLDMGLADLVAFNNPVAWG